MKKIVLYMMIVGLIPCFTACENWFDVNPKSQVKNDDLFENERGFHTALFGIYTSMAQSSLYGGELTMAFTDVLAQYYSIQNSTSNYYDVSQYRYDNLSVQNKIETIWNGMYRSIINCNNLLENIEGKEQLFGGKNYNLIRGEVLGLRAYLHFDLLRLFAPSFAVGRDRPAIPYVDRVVRKAFPQLTSEQAVARILGDCRAALADLQESDPLGPSGIIPDEDEEFLQYRTERMNYLAVKALMARVYLWSGNTSDAGILAGEVIGAAQRPGTTLPVFSLYTDKISDYSNMYFGEKTSVGNLLFVSPNGRKQTYETEKYGSYDSRLDGLVVAPGSIPDEETNTGTYFVTKYVSGVIKPVAVPLIRMNEVYYIQAECRKNLTEAFEDLNTVRQAYRIPAAMDLNETVNVFEDELYKEYRKTFLAEGQLFYYLKRKDVKVIPGIPSVSDPRTAFTLPIPMDEFEFGNMIR